MLSRVLLRNSHKRALMERTSSSIRAFGSRGGDGHFQPPFVQRARDTRKVWFCDFFYLYFLVDFFVYEFQRAGGVFENLLSLCSYNRNYKT